jgi:glyoxylase-like metal-dependent hydrolase (beta-lactamase superfamily II)
MCPYGGKLLDGLTPGIGPATLVCHCLLLETPHGLTLIDTGLGTLDLVHPEKRLSTFFRLLNRPEKNVELSAFQQIRHLGFKSEDVQNIVLTNLDFDHAGGISDFPHAKVHVFKNEYQQALHKKGFINSRRYRPAQWHRHEHWKKYEASGEKWFGFDAVRDLDGVDSDILMIPLVGHSWGHCGIAVKTGRDWLLLAGDAYFNAEEMDLVNPHCPAGAEAYQTMMEVDRKARLFNQKRLRDLIRSSGERVKVCCSHDPAELAALQYTGTSTSDVMRFRARPRSRPELNPGL